MVQLIGHAIRARLYAQQVQLAGLGLLGSLPPPAPASGRVSGAGAACAGASGRAPRVLTFSQHMIKEWRFLVEDDLGRVLNATLRLNSGARMLPVKMIGLFKFWPWYAKSLNQGMAGNDGAAWTGEYSESGVCDLSSLAQQAQARVDANRILLGVDHAQTRRAQVASLQVRLRAAQRRDADLSIKPLHPGTLYADMQKDVEGLIEWFHTKGPLTIVR